MKVGSAHERISNHIQDESLATSSDSSNHNTRARLKRWDRESGALSPRVSLNREKFPTPTDGFPQKTVGQQPSMTLLDDMAPKSRGKRNQQIGMCGFIGGPSLIIVSPLVEENLNVTDDVDSL